ncbi:unnamed protein product [Phytomonas sp. EM1]|nr:unnamed protein product [Phytomonas sp. EM1]|eukprot:CCW65388.1 unnamed protein product [Phytomonas sp. isolate EM1]
MSVDYTALKTRSRALFSAAMPPLVQHYDTQYVDPNVYAPLTGGHFISSPPLSYEHLGAAFSGFSVAKGGTFSRAWTDSTPGAANGVKSDLLHGYDLEDRFSRQHEASLIRREAELRSEFHRLMEEGEERMRIRYEQQRRDDDAEERRLLIEAAAEVERERTKRIETQQERLLQRERELEEWKQERAKEIEVLRQKQWEEEERRRELRYQRQLQYLKEQAEVREASRVNSEDISKLFEATAKEVQETLIRKMKEELSAREESYQSALRAHEKEWLQKVESMEAARLGELAGLQQQLSQDRQRLALCDQQLSEARHQLVRLLSEVDAIHHEHQQRPSGESAASKELLETQRSFVSELQRQYEEDKASMLRSFAAERDRVRAEHDSRIAELKSHHSMQLQAKLEEITGLERRLAQTSQELHQEKAKTTLRMGSGSGVDPYGLQESAHLKEDIRALRQANQELEERKSRLERRLREADERADAHLATLQTLQNEHMLRNKSNEDTIADLRHENQQLKSRSALQSEEHAEELSRLRRQIHDMQETAHSQHTQSVEVKIRQLAEQHENERHQWGDEQRQLNKTIKSLEANISGLQRRLELSQREGETASAELREREKQLAERNALVQTLQHEIDAKAAIDHELQEAKASYERLQASFEADRAQLQQRQKLTLEAKEKELQKLRSDLSQAKSFNHTLQDEVSHSKLSVSESTQLLKRQLSEREAEIIQARLDIEAGRRAQEEWKSTHEELQRRHEQTVSNLQKRIKSCEDELAEANARIVRLLGEKREMELALQNQGTQLRTTLTYDDKSKSAPHESKGSIEHTTREVQGPLEGVANRLIVEQEPPVASAGRGFYPGAASPPFISPPEVPPPQPVFTASLEPSMRSTPLSIYEASAPLTVSPSPSQGWPASTPLGSEAVAKPMLGVPGGGVAAAEAPLPLSFNPAKSAVTSAVGMPKCLPVPTATVVSAAPVTNAWEVSTTSSMDIPIPVQSFCSIPNEEVCPLPRPTPSSSQAVPLPVPLPVPSSSPSPSVSPSFSPSYSPPAGLAVPTPQPAGRGSHVATRGFEAAPHPVAVPVPVPIPLPSKIPTSNAKGGERSHHDRHSHHY